MVPPLLHADDMVLLATLAAGLLQQLRQLEAYCAERGLTVNIDKTRVMLLSGADDSICRLGKRQKQHHHHHRRRQTPAKVATAAAIDTGRDPGAREAHGSLTAANRLGRIQFSQWSATWRGLPVRRTALQR